MQATAAAKQIRIACYDAEADTLSMLEPSGPSPMSRGGHSVSGAFLAPHAMQSTLPCSTCHMSCLSIVLSHLWGLGYVSEQA